MKKQILSLAAASTLLLAASSSFADIVLGDADLSVSMDITSTCTVTVISTALPATSGNVASTPTASTGSIVVDCVGYPGVLLLDGGAKGDGSTRYLTDTAAIGADMAYTLTNNADGLEVGDLNPADITYAPIYTAAGWANGINYDGVGPAAATYSIDATVTVAAGQQVGTYTDLVGVTLTL